MLFGLDIASYQGYPDCARLAREGHTFAISKLTGEGAYVNPYCGRNATAARAAGLIWGVYDWVEPQSGLTGEQAAADYLRVREAVCPPQAGDLLTVDFETPDWANGPRGRAIEPFMRAYLYALRDRAGQPVIVYTAPYFLAETGARGWDWLGRDFALWQAAPGAGMVADDAPWPATPAPFRATLIHQHQWYATSGAIVGQFDRDRCRGTREELLAYGYPGAVTATVAPTAPAEEADVREPSAGTFTAYVNDKQESIFVWNAGGVAERIDGIAAIDLGLSVVNPQGERYDRSIQQNVVQAWRDRRGASGGA